MDYFCNLCFSNTCTTFNKDVHWFISCVKWLKNMCIQLTLLQIQWLSQVYLVSVFHFDTQAKYFCFVPGSLTEVMSKVMNSMFHWPIRIKDSIIISHFRNDIFNCWFKYIIMLFIFKPSWLYFCSLTLKMFWMHKNCHTSVFFPLSKEEEHLFPWGNFLSLAFCCNFCNGLFVWFVFSLCQFCLMIIWLDFKILIRTKGIIIKIGLKWVL